MLSRQIFLIALLSITTVALAQAPKAKKPQLEDRAILQKVVNGIRENYRKLPHLACKLKTTYVNVPNQRDVPERLLPRDADAHIAVELRRAYISKVLMSGESLRIDSRRIGMGEETSESFHDGFYNFVNPGDKWVSFYSFKDMPNGLANRDPRDAGASNQKMNFLRELMESRLTRHATIATTNGERLVLHLERDLPESKTKRQWSCEVDPRHSYLPFRIIHYMQDNPKFRGKINWVHDATYEEVPERKAWFLKKSVERFYWPKFADKPDQDNWVQQVTSEVQGSVQLLDKVDASSFEIKIRPENDVRDNTGGAAGNSQ